MDELDNKKIFATRLMSVLTAKNISQYKLAKDLNVSKQTVSRYTNAINYPEVENLIILAKLLNVSCDYLLGFSDNMDAVDKK